MNIYCDILKMGKRLAQSKTTPRLTVIDTLQVVLQELSRGCKAAPLLNASALLDDVAEVCRYTYNYESGLDYGNIAPVFPSVWIELADAQTAVNLAAFVVYTENNGQADLAGQAQKHNIKADFRWRCRTRCFIKKANGKTLPLKWEWIEYVESEGRSVRGLMQPVGLPGALEEAINSELEQMQFVQSDLCALVANLGLYTIDMINNRIATLQSPPGLRHKPPAGRKREVEHYIVDLNFNNNPVIAPVSTLRG